jgi:hypothetical protein
MIDKMDTPSLIKPRGEKSVFVSECHAVLVRKVTLTIKTGGAFCPRKIFVVKE